MTAFSVLDLVPVSEGKTPRDALRQSLELAQWCESLGYQRYWVAEHHNMVGIASAATSVVVGYLAGGTSTIRVGAGGIMLPNHSPLVIAEQFGTLESLYPGRIDLGLGRAPGTDQMTLRALRRDPNAAEDFPNDVLELQAFLGPLQPDQRIQAVPGTDCQVPLWILGSSLYGSQLAAMLGLPYAFASHFAPDALMQALQIYRSNYRPSSRHPQSYAMVALNLIVADSDAEAAMLLTSLQLRFLGMQRGQRGPLPRPVESMEGRWNAQEKAGVERMLAETIAGSPASIRAGLQATIQRTGADEFIVACAVHDNQAKLHSYSLLDGLNLD